MAIVDLNLEGISTEEIKEQLKKYKKKGFGWGVYGMHEENYQIWTPHLCIEEPLLIHYFENVKLEFGNKEQIEMLEAFNLLRLLINPDNPYYSSDAA